MLQARTFSLAPGRRSSPISPYTSTDSGSTGVGVMSGPQHGTNNRSGGGWNSAALQTLADDTLEQNGVEDWAGAGSATRHAGGLSRGGTVTNHFAPRKHQQHHALTSSPKHTGYDPARYKENSPHTGSGCFMPRKDKTTGLSTGDTGRGFTEEVKLDLDYVLTSSADEDSGFPRSSSSHKASSDSHFNSLPSDESQDDEDSFNHRGSDRYSDGEEGDEEERQSLLRGGKKSGKIANSLDGTRRPRERSLVRVRPTQPDPDYDEEELALNTSTGSSEYVESPRSDISSSSSKPYGVPRDVEMQTRSYSETPHPAGRRSPPPVNIHNQLYSKNRNRSRAEVWDYSENSRQRDDDNDEDDEDDGFSSSCHRPYENQRGSTGNTSVSSPFPKPSQVDERVPFLGPGPPSSAMALGSAQYSYNMHELGTGAARKAKGKKGRSKGE